LGLELAFESVCHTTINQAASQPIQGPPSRHRHQKSLQPLLRHQSIGVIPELQENIVQHIIGVSLFVKNPQNHRPQNWFIPIVNLLHRVSVVLDQSSH